MRDLDLSVEEGEIVTLLGANGAGKTTTLLTVSGLLPIIAGEICVLGDLVGGRGRRPHRIAAGGVAHVPEDRVPHQEWPSQPVHPIGPAQAHAGCHLWLTVRRRYAGWPQVRNRRLDRLTAERGLRPAIRGESTAPSVPLCQTNRGQFSAEERTGSLLNGRQDLLDVLGRRDLQPDLL